MKKVYYLVLILSFLIVTADISAADWTFMCYAMASPDMEETIIDRMLEMASLGSNENLKIWVQVDWAMEQPSSKRKRYIPNPFYSGASLYLIYRNEISLFFERGEINMGDKANLKKFFDSCYDSSCSNYILDFLCHGSGFESWDQTITQKKTTKSMCYDDVENDSLSIDELADAMAYMKRKIRKSLRFVVFDSCLVQNLHAIYPLQGLVDYSIGSESTTLFGAVDYKDMLYLIHRDPDAHTTKIRNSITDAFGHGFGSMYYGSITTAVNVWRVKLLKDYVNWLAEKLLYVEGSLQVNGLPLFGDPPRYTDLGYYCRQIVSGNCGFYNNWGYEDVKDIAQSIISLLDETCEYSCTTGTMSYKNYDGLGIWIPAPDHYKKVREFHKTTKLAKDTLWDEFLDKLLLGRTDLTLSEKTEELINCAKKIGTVDKIADPHPMYDEFSQIKKEFSVLIKTVDQETAEHAREKLNKLPGLSNLLD